MTYLDRENSAHDAEPVELYRFTLGLQEWLYTSADLPFTLDGKTYRPVFIERGDLSVTDETPRESMEVTLARDNPTAAMFSAEAPDGTLYLTIYRQHRGVTEFIHLGRWRVLGVTWANSLATQNCEPLFTSLSRPLLRIRFSVTCRHDVFDDGCTLSAAAFAVPFTVSAILGTTVSALAFGALPSGRLRGGKFDAGPGRRRRVIDHVGDTVTLTTNIPGLALGDSGEATPGCNKLIGGDCLLVFNNTINHGGFPYIPNQNPYEVGVK